ncbi:dTDP-glucose 4,6-dehydratase [Candidatus Woesearchaeota archaeon]|nr:dTDP-glucose 4,6-dehydratase [Candidatus Woesearchaeota archaeon]
MKILVTGGCGFIGSNFIRYMLSKYNDCEIINLDALTYAGNSHSLEDVHKNYTFIKGSITDKTLVHELVSKVDIIVHFAAESHVDKSIANPENFIMTNVYGTYVLLEAARKYGIKRFHHISTDEVYGALGETGKFTDSTNYEPRSPYSASKAASDHIVRSYYHTYNLPITITNCSNNYGPYQYPEKLIPLAITNLIRDKKIPLYGKGLNVRDWIHVDDHNSGVDCIIRHGKPGRTYLLGGSSEMRNIDVIQMILKAFGLDSSHIEYVPDRKGHDFRYAIDFSNTTKELGWSPKIQFEEGLQKTIEWYKQNESWWRPLLK